MEEKYRDLESIYGSCYGAYNIQDDPNKFQAKLAYIDALVGEIVRKASPRNILDVGCGVATFRPFFEKRGVEYFGVDMSEDGIEMIDASHLGKIGAAYAEKLPLSEGVLDCVLAHHVVEHLLSPSQFIAEFSRVLSPNGHVVVVTPVLPFGSIWLWRRVGLFQLEGHVSMFERSKWKELFAHEGFVYIEDFQDIVATDPPSYRFSGALSNIPVIGDGAVRVLSRIVRGSYLFKKRAERGEGSLTPSESIEFVCPSCYSRLIPTATVLRCSSCGNRYDISRGFPNFKHELPHT